MIISAIVAVDENNVIGKDNNLIWHLPRDLKHFKETTSGHCMLSGRKNYESIGRPLPKRTNIILTRQKDYQVEGCITVNTIDEGLAIGKEQGDDEFFITGGGELYKQSMHLWDKLYLTQVHYSFEGDVYFPEINFEEWNEVGREHFEPDEKNKYPFTILELERKK